MISPQIKQMNTDGRREAESEEARLNALTERITGCAFRVHNVLGCGFAEKVYENSLVHELRKDGLQLAQQHEIDVI